MIENYQNNKLLKPVFAAILAALALVVGYVEIVWPVAPWLKLDFSEVVILASFILIGFNHTLAVIVIRSVVRWLITANSTDVPFPFFGETVAIIASLTMVLLYMLFSKVFNNKKESQDSLKIQIIKDVIVAVIVTLLMTIFMVIINFFIVTPSFASQGAYPFFTSFVNSGKYDGLFGGGYLNYLIFIITLYGPFNLVKFALCLTVFTLIKKPLFTAITIE
ncbi:MAG: MPN527 family putative ECF transporter permease subunit [Acholeplasmataceae bacterium]|jgi:riboflavin transporter FmnP